FLSITPCCPHLPFFRRRFNDTISTSFVTNCLRECAPSAAAEQNNPDWRQTDLTVQERARLYPNYGPCNACTRPTVVVEPCAELILRHNNKA
ncbi:hypothetical protein BC936DRAFT_141829, partial [Jimgerdemannia flammicorona]